uniref:Uncharacterized protein n=1 Tax=Arundo donax TaxID=35708 RepID=A0A0A8YS37_ARUDO
MNVCAVPLIRPRLMFAPLHPIAVVHDG